MLTALAMGPVFLAFGSILGAMLCSVALSVLSFSQYSFQREVLKGNNPAESISVMYSQLLMCSVVFTTLLIISPMLGPFAPIIPGIWAAFMIITILSALCAGGYEKLHEDWGSKSNVRFFRGIITLTDFILSLIPEPIRNFLGNALSKLHRNLGTFYLIAQIGLFLGIASTISPPLGLAGLAYFRLEYLRTQKELPYYIAAPLERFRYWMGLCSGIFIPSAILQLYTYYNIVCVFILKVASPLISKLLFGRKYQTQTLQGKNNSANEEKSIIDKEINLERLDLLLQQSPQITKLKKDQHNDGLGRDLDRLREEWNKFCEEYKVFSERKASYDNFKLLRSGSGLNKLKYYLEYIPRNLSWHLTSIWHYPKLPKAFLHKKSSENNFSVTKSHMADGKFSVPKSEKINLKDFLTLVENKARNNNKVMADIRVRIDEADEKTKEDFLLLISAKDKEKVEELNSHIGELESDIAELRRFDKYLKTSGNIILSDLEKNLSKNGYAKSCTTAAVKDKPSYVTLHRLLNGKYKDLENKKAEKIFTNHAGELALSVCEDNSTTVLESVILELCEQIDNKRKERRSVVSDDVYLQLLNSRLKKVCDQIENGNVGWDKSYASVSQWQDESNHVISSINKLLQKSDDDSQMQASTLYLNIALEGGDFCAKALYDVTHDIYTGWVVPNLIGESSTRMMLGNCMRSLRNRAFEKLYNVFKGHELVKAFLFHVDFDGRHDRGYIYQLLQDLHLDVVLYSHNDLSNENSDFLKEISAQLIAKIISILLLTCEQGYSVDGIIDEMWIQVYAPTNSLCSEKYNANACLINWAADFKNPEVLEYIKKTINSKDELAVKQLLALMLVDNGVFELNHPEDKEKFNLALKGETAMTPNTGLTVVPALEQTSPSLLFAAHQQDASHTPPQQAAKDQAIPPRSALKM